MRHDRESIVWSGGTLLSLVAIGLMLLMLSGCTATRYVPVEQVRTEYVGADTTALMRLVDYLREQVRQKDRAIDSLMQSYSEKIVLNDKGDTLRHDKERIVYRSSYREKDLEREVTRRDSIINVLQTQLESVKSDSIPVPYPVEKRVEVERPLRWWQTALMCTGAAALITVAFLLMCRLKFR